MPFAGEVGNANPQNHLFRCSDHRITASRAAQPSSGRSRKWRRPAARHLANKHVDFPAMAIPGGMTVDQLANTHPRYPRLILKAAEVEKERVSEDAIVLRPFIDTLEQPKGY